MAQAGVMTQGQPDVAGRSSGLSSRSGWVWVYKGVPLAALFLLIWFELLFPVRLNYNPSYLSILNALVLPVILAGVAVLAAIGVLRSGRLQLVWLGAGAVALGLTALAANTAGIPRGLNVSPAIQSIGALLAGVLQFTGIWLAFRRPSLSPPRPASGATSSWP